MIPKERTLALYEQVGKDEYDVKEVIKFLKLHPRLVLSIETLDMIWDGLLQAANDFHRAVIVNPQDDALEDKAEMVRYYKKIFYNNIVIREIYANCNYLPEFCKKENLLPIIPDS